MNTLPSPRALCTLISPLICWTRLFTMGIPRPVPVIRDGANVVSRANGSNICSRNSSVMPMPVSETTSRHLHIFACRDTTESSTSTESPGKEYLTAFETRLFMICSILIGSHMTGGIRLSILTFRLLPSRSAVSLNNSAAFSTHSDRSVGV